MFSGSDGLYWFKTAKHSYWAHIDIYHLDSANFSWGWIRRVAVDIPNDSSDVAAVIDSHAGKVLVTPLIDMNAPFAYEFNVFGSEVPITHPIGLPNPPFTDRSYGQFMVLP